MLHFGARIPHLCMEQKNAVYFNLHMDIVCCSRLVEDEEDINILNICGSKAYNMDLLNEDHRDYTLCKTKFSNKKIKDIIDWTDFYEFQPDQNIWQTDTEEKKNCKKREKY